MIGLNMFSLSLVIGLQTVKRSSSADKMPGEIYRGLPFPNTEGAQQGQNVGLSPFLLLCHGGDMIPEPLLPNSGL